MTFPSRVYYCLISLLLLTGPLLSSANTDPSSANDDVQNDPPGSDDPSDKNPVSVEPRQSAAGVEGKDKVGGPHDDVHSTSNDDQFQGDEGQAEGHGGEGQGDAKGHGVGGHDSNSSHDGSHVGIHVVQVDFALVQKHLIIILFMIAVVICKIGKTVGESFCRTFTF